MSSISINGKTFTIPSGKNISIVNGVVSVDGKVITDSVQTDCSVDVIGNVQGNVDAGGSQRRDSPTVHALRLGASSWRRS